MDFRLHCPQAACASTGRPFVAGEILYSALVRAAGSLDRVDVSADAWQGPPEDTIAWWRSIYPAAGEAGPILAPVDVLLDALDGLEDAGDAPLRYLLALQLVRRRVLRIVDESGATQAADEVVFTCRKRGRDYRVRTITAAEAAADGVESRLAALLWSGGAA
jgi:hypothetical protein